MSTPSVWLRGPVPGIDPWLQPVAHALLQAREDFERILPGLSEADLWTPLPGGGAPAGFHVKHAAGSLERLFTYARGESLSREQFQRIAAEKDRGDSWEALLAHATGVIDAAIEELKRIPANRLLEPREIGRAQLPSTVLGVLVHAGEHTARHVGQLITTLKGISENPSS